MGFHGLGTRLDHLDRFNVNGRSGSAFCGGSDIVVEGRRGGDAFAYKREFTGTATPKRVIFIIIPIRSSRCAYYKFSLVILSLFFPPPSLFLAERDIRPSHVATAAPVGSPAQDQRRDDSAASEFRRESFCPHLFSAIGSGFSQAALGPRV